MRYQTIMAKLVFIKRIVSPFLRYGRLLMGFSKKRMADSPVMIEEEPNPVEFGQLIQRILTTNFAV